MIQGDPNDLSEDERAELLSIARQSLQVSVSTGDLPGIDPNALPDGLKQPGAAFVTLHLRGELRGCIGSLVAWRSLAMDVAENTRAAALRDPRFSPVSPAELSEIDLHISVLTPPEVMTVCDEDDLLAQLVPYQDGLILSCGNARATFLPAVWEQLPDPVQFVTHLKHKAGWAADFWSPDMRCERYQALSIG